MNPVEFMTALAERNDKTEMLLALLYEVVERTGDTREGFFALRRHIDLGYGIAHRYPMSTMTEGSLESMVRDIDNVLATLTDDINRIDR